MDCSVRRAKFVIAHLTTTTCGGSCDPSCRCKRHGLLQTMHTLLVSNRDPSGKPFANLRCLHTLCTHRCHRVCSNRVPETHHVCCGTDPEYVSHIQLRRVHRPCHRRDLSIRMCSGTASGYRHPYLQLRRVLVCEAPLLHGRHQRRHRVGCLHY